MKILFISARLKAIYSFNRFHT